MYYQTFSKLCQTHNVTPADVSRATGISTATLTSWKQGKYTPKSDKLQKIADYFGVTMEYLTKGEVTDAEPYYRDPESREIADFLFQNPEYKTLFSAVRDIPPEDLKLVQDMITRLTRKEE